MDIIPFDSAENLPAFAKDASLVKDLNKEVVRAAAYTVMSIKGKQFTVVRDGVRTVLTKPDDPDEVAQNIGAVIVRANMHAKTYYARKYSGEDSEGARPDCYSMDGISPSPNALNPQSDKCATCPHNQWGSRISEDGQSKGKACQDNARLAISQPDKMEPMLLRVPPASLKGLKEALKIVASRKLPYNGAIMKIGFDRDAPSPKLTFKPVGLLNDTGYGAVKAAYDDEVVRAIVGLDDFAPEHGGDAPQPEPAIEADELDAAIAAKKAKAAKVRKPGAAPARAPASNDESDLMADLDALLGTSDD